MSRPKDFLKVLSALTNSLDDLEDVLEPLLKNSLSDTMASMNLAQRAKMQVLLAYTIQDLLFSKFLDYDKSPCSLQLNSGP
jgi:exosome complex protein LRP1